MDSNLKKEFISLYNEFKSIHEKMDRLNTLMEAFERREVFYIDVGSMDPDVAKSYIERITTEIMERRKQSATNA
jgi:hypothetical protein